MSMFACLNLLVLKTSNLEAMRAFYAALGVSLTQEQHGNGPLHFAGKAGAVVLEVYPLPDDAVTEPTTRLGFAVADLSQVLEALRGIGTPVLSPTRETKWGVRAVVQDPDGRGVELYQK